MGIPAVERERADPRPIGLRQELRSGTCRFGKVSADLSWAGSWARHARLLPVARPFYGRRKLGIVFKNAGKSRVAIAIESEKPPHGIFTRQQHPLRRPRQDRRAAADHKRSYGSDREQFAALRIDTSRWRQLGQHAIKPAALARAGLWQPALQQILAIEMRALAIGRGASMNNDRLSCFEHAVQVWHRRIDRKEVIKLQRRQLAIER